VSTSCQVDVASADYAVAEHLPAVEACSLLSLKAIYSRSKQSADKLAKIAKGTVDTYFDTPCASGRSLNDLLGREDLDAVIIALPIPVQPDFIKRAIKAGKHVLSEKPIAKDVKTATELLNWYQKHNNQGLLLWSVAENYRYMDQVNFGAEQIRKLKGNVVTFSLILHGFIGPDDRYYRTEWYVFLHTAVVVQIWLTHTLRRRRQSPNYSGGCLLDCGIHFVAAIRYLLAAGGESITQVAAFTSSLQRRLVPLDTVQATLQITNANNGTFSLSFGAEHKAEEPWEMQVTTDKGSVTVTPTEVTLSRKGPKGERDEKKAHFDQRYICSHAVEREVASFANAIRTGKMEQRATAEEALKDLVILQAMLESGEDGGAVKSLD